MTRRKFKAPWRARQTPGGYCIEDADGNTLLYCYAKTDRESSASTGHFHLSWEDAERLAMFVASFPERYKAQAD